MKRSVVAMCVMLITLLIGSSLQAQTLVDKWGETNRGKGWQVLNTAATPAGEGAMGAAGPPATWATIRGNFEPVTATEDQAFVVSGKMEYVGAGPGGSYVGLRYALTYMPDAGTLNNQYTDSASWTDETAHYGYEFTPRSGASDIANGGGGAGTQWMVNGGTGWNSTWSNAGYPIAPTVVQAPPLADLPGGVYDWAISVLPLADGTNRFSWYLISEDGVSYWFGGTTIDTMQVTTQFNSICFGVGDGITTAMTGLKLTEVTVGLGEEIDVPARPFSSFYVEHWGETSRGKGWKVLNTADTPVGDGLMGGDAPPATWATIRGYFGQDVDLILGETIIVSGQMEYAGAGPGGSYVGLRYALSYMPDAGTLNNQYTDSASWTDETAHYGYEFTPRSGASDIANGGGGAGTQWAIRGGAGWNSTWSNSGYPIAPTVVQLPPLADLPGGLYDWAISVTPLIDGTNEVRWYLISDDDVSYWYAGTAIDTAQITTVFNNISFGVGDGITTAMTGLNLIAVMVDKGEPIELPKAPFNPFYVEHWGETSRGKGWKVLNTTDTPVGDGLMGGDAPPATWATVRGYFGQDVPVYEGEALIVSGQMEYAGAGPGGSYVGLRYALSYMPDKGTLNNQYTDSASWTDETAHYGYEFTPRSGASDIANGGGGAGTQWMINGGAGWNSTWSNSGYPIAPTVVQLPPLADLPGGIYDWAISVEPLADGTNEIRWYLVSEDGISYWYAGTAIDTLQVTTQFNSISFGVGDGITTAMTGLNLLAVYVDKGEPIELPKAPFNPFYVEHWGKTNRGKGWPMLNTADTPVGDAGMGGERSPLTWATMRGYFGQDVPVYEGETLIISGQMEYTGSGPGGSYVPLRYALTYMPDKGTLNNQYTDSASWTDETAHYGYEFTPRSGAADIANGGGGAGTQWMINGGTGWNSTWSNSGYPIAPTVVQAPPLAELPVGIYNWGISVEPLADGTNEFRWYLVSEDGISYWYAGTAIDTMQVTTKFNNISFGVGDGITATMTGLNLIAVYVDKGEEPMSLPPRPFSPFYVGTWGFIGGNRISGWDIIPGEYSGNVSMAGTGTSGWSALRGEFDYPVDLVTDEALIVTGKMELAGSGFESWSSLRLGLFYSDSAGVVEDSLWSGIEGHADGYMLIPHSGTNDLTNWQGISQMATVGAVVDGAWISSNGASNYALSTIKQHPDNALGSAGEYNFEFSFQDLGDGTTDIRYNIYKEDDSYAFAGHIIDNHDPLVTKMFNSFNIAWNHGTAATALNLVDVYVNRGDAIELPDWVITSVESQIASIPESYNLSQNYPNPFNPTTTVEFALPKTGKVDIVVYDITGRKVAELAMGKMEAGYHKITFNASNLSTGTYFIKMKAGGFTSVKKAVLIK